MRQHATRRERLKDDKPGSMKQLTLTPSLGEWPTVDAQYMWGMLQRKKAKAYGNTLLIRNHLEHSDIIDENTIKFSMVLDELCDPRPLFTTSVKFDHTTVAGRIRELAFLNPELTITLRKEDDDPEKSQHNEYYYAVFTTSVEFDHTTVAGRIRELAFLNPEMTGLAIAVASMKSGECALLYVGWELGYGKEGSFSFPNVPPMADLIYEVELIGFDETKEAIAYMGDDFMFQLMGKYRDMALAVKNPCHLNIAACLIKLKRYEEAIPQCSIVCVFIKAFGFLIYTDFQLAQAN
ncbi:hypothetical protein IFM89_017301 [Coptis chinensis]|uniref:peptidylprolyl isomerase n=1 Tax=Coptis chinensis TaxID=261450 RepID=A0A835H4Z0_9MAGN|nr:hypothetical protein IFM89_017301 [Coptis chinensis]